MSLDRFQKIIIFSADFTVCIVLQNVNIAISDALHVLVCTGKWSRDFFKGGLLGFFCMYVIQHCFICHLSDSTVSEDAESRTVATLGLIARRFYHSAWSYLVDETLPNVDEMRPCRCGWDLAECEWDLAECGWDLAECGWDPEKIQKKLFSLQSIDGNSKKLFQHF